MKYRSYNFELQNSTAQILDVFNNIKISRYYSDGNTQKDFYVPCVYGNRSRVLKSLENRNKTTKLPIITLSMTNLTRDVERTFGIHDGIQYQSESSGSSYNYKRNTAIPINIGYNISIIAKYQQDIDQILSNFMVFFKPDIYVVLTNPVTPTEKIKCQIVWDNSISIQYPSEIDKDTPSRIYAEGSFTFKTWLFPGRGEDDAEDSVIHRINFNPCIQYEDGIGRLQHWYALPYSVSFDDTIQNIICGYIKPPNFDELQISAGISGYWHDISAMCTGYSLSVETSNNLLSSDPVYLTTDESGLLLVTERCYLPRGMSNMSVEDWVDYFHSTLTGDLSGYKECCPYSGDCV